MLGAAGGARVEMRSTLTLYSLVLIDRAINPLQIGGTEDPLMSSALKKGEWPKIHPATEHKNENAIASLPST